MKNLSIISIYCGAILSFFMGVFHTQFYKIFKWKKEFDNLTITNKNILYTIHIALLLLLFGFSILSFLYAKELSMCKDISLGINSIYSIFWLWRIIWQILYFKPDNKSKLLPIHYGLIVYFGLLFNSYMIPIIISFI